MRVYLRRAVFLLVVLAIVTAVVYALRPQPVRVEVRTIVRGAMLVTVDEEGETRIRDRFVVSAPVSGRVQRIDLEPGDRVTAGSPVATLLPADPTPLDFRTRAEAEARVRQAEAALALARASRTRTAEQLEFAETQLERYTELVEDGLVSRETFDTVRADARALRESLNTADAEVSSAERAVDVAMAALVGPEAPPPASAAITIRAPIDGVVLRRIRESEAVIPMGEPLVEIGDLGNIEIVSDLLSADAVRIEPGDRVLIEEWGGGAALEGRVRRIEPSGFTRLSALGVEEQRVNVLIDFVDREEAARHLGDGYRVEIRIVVWEAEDVLEAPTGALFREPSDDAWKTWVVDGGLASKREVVLGQRNALEAEVLSGLEEGDTVIMHASDSVAEGVEVEIQ